MSDYWKTCVEEAFSEIGITATPEQAQQMVKWIEGAYENYGMAHGHECIPNPIREENTRLTNLLKTERSKVHCKNCNGKGRIVTPGPYHSSDSPCWVCHGEGKFIP